MVVGRPADLKTWRDVTKAISSLTTQDLRILTFSLPMTLNIAFSPETIFVCLKYAAPFPF